MPAYSIPYILKPDDQLYFLHIPKTAGTTLIALLDQHFTPSEIFPEQLGQKVKELSASDMAGYRLFRGHLDYDLYKLLPKKPIYLTMLRDPLKRVVSLYEYWKRSMEGLIANDPETADYFREAFNSDLYHFVCYPQKPICLEVENNQVRRIVAHTRDPLDHLTDQEKLEIAKKRIAEEFLFTGLLERFDESLQLLCYSLGWLPIQHYEKRMVSTKPTTTDDLPAQTRDAILERNQLDIALYNFAAELLQERYQAMVNQLIEKSYQDHFAQWNVPQDHLETLTARSTNGLGWYSGEVGGDGKPFMWLGPQKEAFIDVRVPRGCDFAVSVEIVNSIHTEILKTFRFFANGSEVPLTRVSGDEYRGVFHGVIAQNQVDLNPALTRLSFQVERTFSPRELDPNTSDTRHLGLALHNITIDAIPVEKPIEKPPQPSTFQKIIAKIGRRSAG